MKSSENERSAGSRDLREVRESAAFLQGQACTLATRYIQDGTLRLQFNREIAYYAQGIVRDVEDGRKTSEEGVAAIKDEQKSLSEQSFDVTSQAFGLAAGVFQFAGGVGICYASVGTACLTLGVAMMAHGANNIYENGRNLIQNRSDIEGPVRLGYQAVAELSGKQRCAGNVVYGAADLGMSAYGVFKLVTRPDARRLFRYIPTDYVRAYQTANPLVFLIDRTADSITAKSVTDQWNCLYE